MIQLSLIPDTAFTIRIADCGFYKYTVFLNGNELCRFMGLDTAISYIKQRLNKLEYPYKQKMTIIDEVIRDFRIYDDALNEKEKADNSCNLGGVDRSKLLMASRENR